MTAFKRVTIALLGAAGTGKKKLAQAMNDALMQALNATSTATSSTTASATVPLRWKITTDTPLQRLLELAQASGNHPDSTAIDTESTAFQAALAQQRRFHHSLLLGLDLTPSAQAQQPHSAGERGRMDALLRLSLTQGDVPFQVIYGTGDDRLRQALAALGALKFPVAKAETPPAETSTPRKPWVWACDKCSDPVCEHRLLSDLLLNR